MKALALAVTISALVAGEPRLDQGLFNYDRSAPLNIRMTQVSEHEGVTTRDITYQGAAGTSVHAYLVHGNAGGKRAGILFVHWYEPKSPDSNRTQFLKQASELAKLGATSMLIETMWSDPEWYSKRDRMKDYDNSIRQVKELRRALDVLLAQRNVDPNRIAYVGHDFGMMYGAVLAGVDDRPKVWALQAGTTSFADWFLFGPKMEEPARTKFREQLGPLDPVRYIGAAKPVLLQFGTQDEYVPEANRKQLVDAAGEPKTVLVYEAGHGLSEKAIADRQAWLIEQLNLK